MTEDQNFTSFENTADTMPDDALLRKNLRRDNSKIGFSVLLFTCAYLGITLLTVLVLRTIDLTRGTSLFSAFNQYILPINELFVLVALILAFLPVKKMPKYAPKKQGISVSWFLMLLCLCFGVSTMGNIAGNIITAIINAISGKAIGNDVADMLTVTDFWQTFLFAAIVAPILEELFFRKIILDRLRGYGDKIAILVSAVLFGLFHMSIEQLFYTIPLGILFGYIYCITGKIWLSMLLHGVFNFFSGVLNAAIVKKLTGIFDVIASLSPNEIEEYIETSPEFSGSVLFAFFAIIYFLAFFVINIIGVVMFFSKMKKAKLDKGDIPLPSKGIFGSILVNPGMISAVTVMIGFTIIVLFQ